jgi:hypothetical protein
VVQQKDALPTKVLEKNFTMLCDDYDNIVAKKGSEICTPTLDDAPIDTYYNSSKWKDAKLVTNVYKLQDLQNFFITHKQYYLDGNGRTCQKTRI